MYKFYKNRLPEMLNDYSKQLSFLREPNELDYSFYKRFMIHALENPSHKNEGNLIASILSAVKVNEDNQSRRGKNFIQISLAEAKIIDRIDISKVQSSSINHPFGGSAWLLPSELISIGKNHGIISNISDGDSRRKQFAQSHKDLNFSSEVGNDNAPHLYIQIDNTKGGAFFVKIKTSDLHEAVGHKDSSSVFWNRIGERLCVERGIEFLDIDSAVEKIFGAPRSLLNQIYDAALFIFKACILIQAKPECLHKGIDVSEIVTKKVRKKGKIKLVKSRLNSPRFELNLPNEYKSSASLVRLHFRSLHSDRYSRTDALGNKLKVGEPGFVRVIEIKPHLRNGRVSHIKSK